MQIIPQNTIIVCNCKRYISHSLFRLEMRVQKGNGLPSSKSFSLTDPFLSASSRLNSWSTCCWWSENHRITSSKKFSNCGPLDSKTLLVCSVETLKHVSDKPKVYFMQRCVLILIHHWDLNIRLNHNLLVLYKGLGHAGNCDTATQA